MIAGSALGAGLALLFAPKSGKEMRDDISNATTRGLERTKEISSNLSEKAGDIYRQVQDKTLETYRTAKKQLSVGAEKIETSALNAKNQAADAVVETAAPAQMAADNIGRQAKAPKD